MFSLTTLTLFMLSTLCQGETGFFFSSPSNNTTTIKREIISATDFLLPGEPVYSGDIFMVLQSLFSGMCLSIGSTISTPSDKVCMYTPNCLYHQKWILTPEGFL